MRPVLAATALAVALAVALSAPAVSAPVAGDAHVVAAPAPPRLLAERAASSGYHYGATYTQVLTDTPSRGVRATFTVHRPGQVKGNQGQHSIAQIAVGDYDTRAFVEAGWRRYVDGPRLFVFWRPADGSDTCYNFGCGFKDRGKGIRPDALLKPGSKVTIGFKYQDRKWWLVVNGKKSGYYPARLWDGTFTRSDYSSIFGEVYVDPSQRLCADMGNGRRARKQTSAKVSQVAFYDGPPVELSVSEHSDLQNYSVKLTGTNSFRYGGAGAC